MITISNELLDAIRFLLATGKWNMGVAEMEQVVRAIQDLEAAAKAAKEAVVSE